MTRPKMPVVQSRPTSRLLVASLLAALALSGCAIQRISESADKADKQANEAQRYSEQLAARPPLPLSRPSLRKMDGLWVDTTPQALTNKSLGAPSTPLDCPITFNPKAPVTLEEFTRVVANVCGLSIQVTTDATAMLNGTLRVAGQAAPAGGGGAIAAGALPPPTLTAPMMQSSNTVSSTIFSGGGVDSISGISWTNKPLSGLLDLVTARLGLGWKYEDNVATIYYIDTQIFRLYAIPTTGTMSTTVKSGAEKSSGASGSQDSGAFSADGSSQETGVKFQSDIIGDIRKTLETMVTQGLGRVSISPSTGTVTVTDRPNVLHRVKSYIAAENKRITRQVVLNVKVLSVQQTAGDSAGLNWNAIFQTVNRSIGWSTGFTPVDGSGSGSVGIINPSSNWDGSKVLIDALSTQGHVSTLTSPSIMTLNLKPTPVLVGTQTTYLAQVTTNAVEGGNISQQSLTPGTITTGFNMTLLPYLMDGPDMLLQYSINLSALTDLKTASSGGNSIQMPQVDNRIFSQSVRLRSGQTLVLSGFDQTVANSKKGGIGDSSFWLLGGQGQRNDSRDIIVVLITPVIVD